MSDTTADVSQVDASEVQVTPNDVANAADITQRAQADADAVVGAGDAADKPETFDRAYVEKLRAEAASHRTKAKEIEEAKASELEAFKQDMAKALGLVEDTTDDPAKLLEAATKRESEIQAERDKYANEIREYRQSDAIRAASDTAKVTDPKLLEAVLKSNNAFTELDITTDDYGTQVAAMVAEAVQKHPALAQVAPTASGVDTSTTNTGAGQQLTREDLAKMSSTEINQAAREGKLNHLMK